MRRIPRRNDGQRGSFIGKLTQYAAFLLVLFGRGRKASKVATLAKDHVSIYILEPKSPKATIIRHSTFIRLLLVTLANDLYEHLCGNSFSSRLDVKRCQNNVPSDIEKLNTINSGLELNSNCLP